MAFYFLAQQKIHDPEGYQKYLDEVDEVFDKHRGEYLVVDENPVTLEGKWNYNKTVIIKFNSKEEFEDWYYSEDYQRILKYRLAAADGDAILLEGLE